MLGSNISNLLAATLICTTSVVQAAPDFTCRTEKESGLSYHGDRVKMPPLKHRKIIGTWLHTDNHLAVSLERVNNTVYEVLRSGYCTSGSYGRLLNESPGGVFHLDRGEYYRIERNGDLGVYDPSGRFDVYTRRNKVFAD